LFDRSAQRRSGDLRPVFGLRGMRGGRARSASSFGSNAARFRAHFPAGQLE
jgi:hypothetical protein